MPEPVMARRYMFWCLSAAFRNRASLWAFWSAETRGIHDRTYDSNIMTQIGWFYSRRTSESSESRALTRGDTLSLGPGDQALISTMWPLTACPLKMQCDIFTASVSIWHRETRTFETEHVPVQKELTSSSKGFWGLLPVLDSPPDPLWIKVVFAWFILRGFVRVVLFSLLLRPHPPWLWRMQLPQWCRSAPSPSDRLWTYGSLTTRKSDRTHPGPKKPMGLKSFCVGGLVKVQSWKVAALPWTEPAAGPTEWRRQGCTCTSWSVLSQTHETDIHGSPRHQLSAWLTSRMSQWPLGTKREEKWRISWLFLWGKYD